MSATRLFPVVFLSLLLLISPSLAVPEEKVEEVDSADTAATEDEVEAARWQFIDMAMRSEVLTTHRNLLIRAMRASAYGKGGSRADEVRALAGVIGDADMHGFGDLRFKIHAMPEPSDIERVEAYAVVKEEEGATGVTGALDLGGFTVMVGMLNNSLGLDGPQDSNNNKAVTSRVNYSADKFSIGAGVNYGKNDVTTGAGKHLQNDAGAHLQEG